MKPRIPQPGESVFLLIQNANPFKISGIDSRVIAEGVDWETGHLIQRDEAVIEIYMRGLDDDIKVEEVSAEVFQAKVEEIRNRISRLGPTAAYPRQFRGQQILAEIRKQKNASKS
jgi:hypothetical protein